MMGRLPDTQKSDLSELVRAVVEFRSIQPEPGSADMVERIENLVSIFDRLKDVTLSDEPRHRNMQVAILFRMREIKQDAKRRDWNWIGKLKVLYPVNINHPKS